jgi:hypothetical protein
MKAGGAPTFKEFAALLCAFQGIKAAAAGIVGGSSSNAAYYLNRTLLYKIIYPSEKYAPFLRKGLPRGGFFVFY